MPFRQMHVKHFFFENVSIVISKTSLRVEIWQRKTSSSNSSGSNSSNMTYFYTSRVGLLPSHIFLSHRIISRHNEYMNGYLCALSENGRGEIHV